MSEQLALVPEPAASAAGRRGRRRQRSDRPIAEHEPVARVLVDTPLAHLDRTFEYAVPAELDGKARPGVRVRVRFAGRDHDGYLLSRHATAEHTGRLTALRTVVSPEPVLTPQVAALVREVADHYGGTAADVVRLAVPPRHARAERTVPAPDPEGLPVPGEGGAPDAVPGPWKDYPAGPAFLRRLAAGESPAASWLALPSRPVGQDWPDALAGAVEATLASGRGSVVVVPDHRDVDRVLGTVRGLVGQDGVVRLTADLGPEARYTAFLRVLRGHARVVVGTRAAAFAPVSELGLLACWDEADDLHQEPRAPYPHIREVLLRRARLEGAALLLGGLTRSVSAQAWVQAGRVAPVAAEPRTVRASAPAVVVAGEGWQEERDPAARFARIPSVAWRALRAGLDRGPVLVQVPRAGYVVALSCQDCHAPVRCPACAGPVGAAGGPEAPRCRWCATAPELACRQCGSTRRRATGIGQDRTAEELGRAFPGTRVISSAGQHVVPEVEPEPALVVATPGAEPWCPGGYAAVALLDGWRLLERPDLDAQPEALRRWAAAASLGSPCGADEEAPGPTRVVLCGVPPHGGVPAVEALVRWDPGWLARRELDERAELGLPPVRRVASVSGPAGAVADVARALTSSGHELLGTSGGPPSGRLQDDAPEAPATREPPVVATVRERSLADRSDPRSGDVPALAEAVRAVRAARSARKAEDVVRTALDAPEQWR